MASSYDSDWSLRRSSSWYPLSKKLMTLNHLHHVESMANMPSGDGAIPHLNVVILGEAFAFEENDLVFPSAEFSWEALVPSSQKVLTLTSSPLGTSCSSPCLCPPALAYIVAFYEARNMRHY